MIIYVMLFVLGLAIGSFLNVLIDRLPNNKSVVRGRSICDHCKHTLAWYDLVPIVSFVILGRRCRYCRKIISWQYPLIELTTGFLFIFSYINISVYQHINIYIYYIHLIYILVIVSGLLVIFVADLKYHIIPDEILIVQSAAAMLYYLLTQDRLLAQNFLTGILFFLLFFLLVIVTQGKGMGFGDVKLAYLMGFVLGFPHVIVAFYLAFLTGAVFSLILVLAKFKSLKSTIAFGPFLCGATFATMFYGKTLWELFRKIMGI